MSNQQQNAQQNPSPTMSTQKDTTTTATKPATSSHKPEERTSTPNSNNAANAAVDSAQHQNYALSRRGAVDHGTEGISSIKKIDVNKDHSPPEAEMFVHARSMLDDDRYEVPILRRGDTKRGIKEVKREDDVVKRPSG
ncbi:hypothetical protein LTR37_018935 [Vermiconidia calcicola]|uniref:Uncharacterized protein n=1 Tax=Vermiconidia calcicola TaxID=1690605 RepID=A0ACC3MFS2_9PEZI|nr:hypothetical protein LTR37_018935 [Vermiconidia calcicola]